MVRQRRSNDWGFPRWRSYEGERAAAQVRLCDRDGCTAAGDRPAPKAPNSPERWWFCETHAAEYNAGWDYFRGLTAEEAAARAQAEAGERRYRRASHWAWGADGDGSRSRAELDALAVLGVDADSDITAVRAAWRRA
uniref:molecular chaperone DnaJ n=1 Tax=Sandarakinorhabdus rubra TaxID=2672568 RepID=UPI0013DCF90C